jgi:hypothetical protein
MTISNYIRPVTVFVLGLVFPIAVLIQAYSGLTALSSAVKGSAGAQDPAAALSAARSELYSQNDYALFSQLYAESTNQAVVTNKQVMKISVMQIGFAAISLGLMFVVLGINDGGGEGKLAFADINLDFKTASTGALVFIVGAAMATAGGVMKNEYKTVSAQPFGPVGVSRAEATSLNAYKTCAAQAKADEVPACFASLYEQINAKALN